MTITYLITGASRGLGLEFIKQLLSRPTTHIIAAVRTPSTATELNTLQKEYPDRIDIVTIDVSSLPSIETGVKEVEALEIVKNLGIDVLINNAGVLAGGWDNSIEGSIADLESNMKTNLYGVVRITQALLPSLRKGNLKQVFTISSLSGSIGGMLSQTGFAATYSISKAAVNMFMMKLSRDLLSENFTIIPVHPGYVKTDMNGGESGGGEIGAEESISKLLIVFDKVTSKDTGKFYNYTGETIVW